MGLTSHKTKLETLRRHGCLHSKPEAVEDELFVTTEFFDPNDLLQVKYEMVRRVRVEGQPVSRAARSFGLSRPTVYQALSAFERGGLAALRPQRPGPRRAHKLSDEVVDFLEELLADTPHLGAGELAWRCRTVRPVRSPAQRRARVAAPGKKTPLTPPDPTHGEPVGVAHYEELRSRVVAGRIRGVRHGLAILLQRGMAAWMAECARPSRPRRGPGATSSETRLPDERCPALVDILANLALTRFMEVHA